MRLSRDSQAPMHAYDEEAVSNTMLHTDGLTCGTLEPLIAKNLRALAPGQVLEIRSDRKEAAEGIISWLNLTGNTLVKVSVDTKSGQTRHFVRKKMPQD